MDLSPTSMRECLRDTDGPSTFTRAYFCDNVVSPTFIVVSFYDINGSKTDNDEYKRDIVVSKRDNDASFTDKRECLRDKQEFKKQNRYFSKEQYRFDTLVYSLKNC